ncbi:hypothetical protein ACS0TY_009068 [Phlomoides rotata]
MKFVTPLGADASLDRFSKARAIEHLRVLAEEIGGRQEGSPGLRQAAAYIKKQLELIKERADSKFRISSIDSQDSDPSVLLNGHFDTPPGSPGAGVCGSCVASLLELARLTVDSGWLPPRPIIFLFNGAEELFMLGVFG